MDSTASTVDSRGRRGSWSRRAAAQSAGRASEATRAGSQDGSWPFGAGSLRGAERGARLGAPEQADHSCTVRTQYYSARCAVEGRLEALPLAPSSVNCAILPASMPRTRHDG